MQNLFPDFQDMPLTTRVIGAGEEGFEVTDLGNCFVRLYLFSFPPGKTVPMHDHDEIRLTIVRAGRVRFTWGDQTTELGAGDVVTLLPHIPHSLEVLGDQTLLLAELMIVPEEDGGERTAEND